jgi:hypothetical protein
VPIRDKVARVSAQFFHALSVPGTFDITFPPFRAPSSLAFRGVRVSPFQPAFLVTCSLFFDLRPLLCFI